MAIPPSPRLGLPAPSETDPADVPIDIKALRDALDAITSVFLQGAQGAMPAAGVPGRWYFATDTKTIYYDDGTAWQTPTASAGDLKVSGGSRTPSGYLLCDGTAYARTDYSNLYSVIGVAFGAGDGTTTFNVPDLRGRVPMGAGAGAGLTARALGARGGEESHLLTAAEMPSHGHGVSDPGHAHSLADPGHAHSIANYFTAPNGANNLTAGTNFNARQNQVYATGGSGTGMGVYGAVTGIGIAAAGGGGAHNVVQPFQAVNWFIKT